MAQTLQRAENLENLLAEAAELAPLLKEFIVDFEVPDDLRGIRQIAARLERNILPFYQKKPDRSIRAWAERRHQACAWFHSEFIAGSAQADKIPTVEDPSAFHGIYDSNPLYALLGHYAETAENRQVYEEFLSEFILAYRTWREKIAERPHWLATACREARRLSKTRSIVHRGEPAKTLKVLPLLLQQMKNSGGQNLAREIDQLHRRANNLQATEVEMRSLDTLSLVFQNHLPGDRVSSRREGAIGSGGAVEIVGGLGTCLYFQSPGADVIEIIHKPGSNTGAHGSDGTPTIKIGPSGAPSYTREDDRKKYISNAGRSMALARSHLLLPLDMDALSAWDLEIFTAELGGTSAPELEVSAFLALAFSAGLGTPQSANLYRLKNLSAHRDGVMGYVTGGHLIHTPFSGQSGERLCVATKCSLCMRGS